MYLKEYLKIVYSLRYFIERNVLSYYLNSITTMAFIKDVINTTPFCLTISCEA